MFFSMCLLSSALGKLDRALLSPSPGFYPLQLITIEQNVNTEGNQKWPILFILHKTSENRRVIGEMY